MKLLVVVALACVLAVEAQVIPGAGLGSIASGVGMMPGIGGFNQGNQYGAGGYGGGSSGYNQGGYQQGGGQGGYDRGHQESSYSSVQQGHQSSSHDIGGGAQYGSAGGGGSRFGNYGGGQSQYGSGFAGGFAG